MDERADKWVPQALLNASRTRERPRTPRLRLEHDFRGELNAARPTASEEWVADSHITGRGE